MAIAIRESFAKDVIEEYNADVTEVEEQQLRAVVEELWEGEVDESTYQLALLAFVAGRAHESDAREGIPAELTITLKREVLEQFIEFLVDGK